MIKPDFAHDKNLISSEQLLHSRLWSIILKSGVGWTLHLGCSFPWPRRPHVCPHYKPLVHLRTHVLNLLVFINCSAIFHSMITCYSFHWAVYRMELFQGLTPFPVVKEALVRLTCFECV